MSKIAGIHPDIQYPAGNPVFKMARYRASRIPGKTVIWSIPNKNACTNHEILSGDKHTASVYAATRANEYGPASDPVQIISLGSRPHKPNLLRIKVVLTLFL